MDNSSKILEIKNMAKNMRKHVLDTALIAGKNSSHFGGSLSTIEIIATLFSIMKINPESPQLASRDRFILSKGHGCLGYYAALAEKKFIEIEELKTFEKSDSDLLGHPVMNRKKGIEFSNGSLGMGLSLGIGVALAGKKKNINYKVYVLIGDGECNEGSIWEACLSAPNLNLSNLTTIIDRNNFQQTGSGEEIMNLGDLGQKWNSFGWEVSEVNGHDTKALYDILNKQNHSHKPICIIANTIKGKGFSFAENNNEWHHAILTQKQYELALDELEKNYK